MPWRCRAQRMRPPSECADADGVPVAVCLPRQPSWDSYVIASCGNKSDRHRVVVSYEKAVVIRASPAWVCVMRTGKEVMRSVRLVPSACLVFVVTVTLLGCTPPLAPRPQSTRSTDSKVIVFVCDHGVAKSALAAALFNDMAVKRGLSSRAERRAADTPQREPSLSTDKGLAADGLPIPEGVPLQLSARDIREALRVVTLGISRPVAGTEGKSEDWADVPVVGDG